MKRATGIIAAIGLTACTTLSRAGRHSESVTDPSAGMNGGFEIVRAGLPINWLVYTPRTIPAGDYDLVVDTADKQAGNQSLKFVVRQCGAEGGWRSPGLSQEFDATPGAKYRIGFWVKNDGAEFLARVGGISATRGGYETIVRSSDAIGAWKHYEHEFTLPAEFRKLRFELNIVRPGTFWIDEVTISEIRS